jgi:hypothetical protein
MTTGNKINFSRVAFGGAVAGLVLFVVNGIVNGIILKDDFEQWASSMAGHLNAPSMSEAMCLWTLMCLIQGFVGVWIYAGIRPRYGAGPKTALISGFILWILTRLSVSFDFIALGVLPVKLIEGQVIGGLFGLLLGVITGAWIYKETI